MPAHQSDCILLTAPVAAASVSALVPDLACRNPGSSLISLSNSVKPVLNQAPRSKPLSLSTQVLLHMMLLS